MSYTFVNTFDYKTAAGVQIDNDPSHTIQLNPSIRFIGNSKNGWQPYASVGMVWNLLNKSGSTANGVKLPETYVKPYVEYGVGLQKRWADKYSAFLQAMLRNGGRNGVSLTAGFRWSLGKEGKPIEKVSNPQNRQSVDTNRKVIKKTS
jgi:outer membrane autotransporter protein